MLIEYNHVNIYQQDTIILKDVNFGIDKGEFAYIIGKVGSGKSSLLKSLYCELDLYSEDCKKAEILGRNLLTLRRKDIPELRRHLGIIFQDFQLLSDRNVHDNLQFVLKATGWKDKEEIEQRISEVLEDVEMTEKTERMPHELSGGEQQRIAIARAILNKPKVIIADEPTGNLDPETANNIIQLLRNVTQTGTSVVMTTHNIPLLKDYPGIVYRCCGKHLELVTDDYNKIMMLSDDTDSSQETYNSGYEVREDLSV